MNLADTSYSNPTQELLKHSTVVCVTDQRQCERLIKAGRVIADLSKTNLTVISVVNPDRIGWDTAALEYLFGVSKQNNAVMSIQYSDDPLRCISEFIRQNVAINVVTGMREGDHSILPKLWQKFSHTSFFTVNLQGQVCPTQQVSPDAGAPPLPVQPAQVRPEAL